MTGSARKPGRLAGRIMSLTLSIGLATVVVSGAVAVVGVSNLARRQIGARDEAYLQVTEDAILARLQSIDANSARVANAVAGESRTDAIDERITMLQDASDGTISQIDVVDTRGRIIASTPGTTTDLPPAAETAYGAALRGVTGFVSSVDSSGTRTLWLTRTVFLGGVEPVVIVVKVNTTFVKSIVAASNFDDGRVILVLQNGAPIINVGDSRGLIIRQATWVSEGEGSGGVTVPASQGMPLTGHYNDVQGVEGIQLRLVILEPRFVGFIETAGAVTPSMLVLVVGGITALLAAWLISSRLVAPLRDLEEAAYRAANGSYVKPIAEDRDDEVGQVAKAFNAVALRLNALHDLSQLLASASQLDQVLDGILSAMGHIVGPGTAAVYLLDRDGRWLVPVRVRGVELSYVSSIDAYSDGWLATALTDSEPVLYSADPETIATELPGLGEVGRCAMIAPLIAGRETLGAVVVLLESEQDTSQAEREMVRTFSAQAAVAVQNSRLFAIETESRRVSDGLREIAERLARPDGLSDTLHEIELIVADLFGAREATFAFADRSALGLPPAADESFDAGLLDLALRRLAPGDAVQPVVVKFGEDAAADNFIERTGAERLMLVPVALDRPHGAVLGLALPQLLGSRRDAQLATSVANELALALENAYLYEQAVVRANNLETIFRISQAVGSSLQVNVVLNRVLDVVQKILSADALALMTYDQRRRTITTAMARGAVSPDLVDRVFTPADDIPGYVFTTGVPATYKDLHEGMGGLAGDAAAHGLRSLLAVPLLARGRSIGVLTVFSAEVGAFSDEDRATLQTFASQAALAIDTARLYSREHEVASILQRSILPGALPEYDEVEAGSVYAPAGGDAEIGGDYYDLFRSTDGGIVFAIADVCGKGVVAATKTSMIKYSVRSLAAAGLSPARILGEINRMVTETGDPSDIVTLWVGLYDPKRGVLTWASGGHPAGLLQEVDDGECVTLTATGPLLGALSDVVYGEQTVSMRPGDTVLLYTDGVTEARSGTEFFGEKRVHAALRVGGSADEVAQRLLVSVRRFVRSELRDDVAVLVLRVREGVGEGMEQSDEERSAKHV